VKPANEDFMFLARITGSLVATHKVESLIGQKLLLVEPLRVDEKDQKSLKPTGRSFVVVDTVGAGEGEVVLCVQGSSARFTPGTKELPIDAAIIGIVDTVQVKQKTVFKAGNNRLMNQNPYSVRNNLRFAGDLQSLGPKFDQQLRVMQIIAVALMMGVLMFFGHCAGEYTRETSSGKETGDDDNDCRRVCRIDDCQSFVIPALITKAQLNKLKSEDFQSPKRLRQTSDSLLAIYRTQLIITLALLEGAAFFNLVGDDREARDLRNCCRRTSGVDGMRFPNANKVSFWVQDKLSEL
jgi:ethanolamine utilization protein EutN